MVGGGTCVIVVEWGFVHYNGIIEMSSAVICLCFFIAMLMFYLFMPGSLLLFSHTGIIDKGIKDDWTAIL